MVTQLHSSVRIAAVVLLYNVVVGFAGTCRPCSYYATAVLNISLVSFSVKHPICGMATAQVFFIIHTYCMSRN